MGSVCPSLAFLLADITSYEVDKIGAVVVGWGRDISQIWEVRKMDLGKLLEMLKSKAFIGAVVGLVFLFFGERGGVTLPTLIGAVVVIVTYIIGSAIEGLTASIKAYAEAQSQCCK